jgi:hypothetical protein
VSKRFKEKLCAYCGASGSSSTSDHVLARAFFFKEDRSNLPQVPACLTCNNRKSELEHYVSSTLLIGSQHADGDRYRQEMVRPRLDKNLKLRSQLRVDHPPQLVKVAGLCRFMHAVTINAAKVTELLQLIVRGLYHHHFGKPLDPDWYPDVTMLHPDHEAAMWAQIQCYFPPGTERVGANLGRASFLYSGIRSPGHAGFSAWKLAWHGCIPLHGRDGSGADYWWAITRPTQAAVERAKPRRQALGPGSVV